jgi:hypothetical protein
VEAVPPGSGSFTWSNFFRRLLEAAREPLIEKKVLVERLVTGKPSSRGDTTEALRLSAENMVKLRNPYVLIIDEAQSITKVVSGRRFVEQADMLKSLSNLARVNILLMGTHELLRVSDFNGQLSRRMIVRHFRRYRVENEADMKQFLGILKYFQERLPLEKEPDLVSHWKDLYGLSLGLVGLLKEMLTYALIDTLVAGRKTMDYKAIERHALSDERRDKITEEIRACEKAMREDVRWSPTTSAAKLDSPIPEGDEVEESNVPPKRERKGRVGRRKPGRDPVGKADDKGSDEV